MRILTYNFLQPGDPSSKSGGVAVYQANLVRALMKAGHDVVCLSSGDRYSPVPGPARLTHTRAGGIDRAVVVNSPVFAPAHSSFHHPETYTDDPGLDDIPRQLRARHPELDVLHFQNIEGLTAGFFRKLRQAFPTSAIVLSAHNYNLVCPQVNLWHRETRACADYRDGRACVNCTFVPDTSLYEANNRRMDQILARLRLPKWSRRARLVVWGVRLPIRLKRLAVRLASPPPKASSPALPKSLSVITEARSAAFRRYRETNLTLCTEVFDRVLAVSERTGAVLAARGVPAGRIAISPIGTAHAARLATAERVMDCAAGELHIAYLGYMRADKGFYALLDALEELPEAWAQGLRVTIAAPIHDVIAVERLRAIAHRFRDIQIHNGYTHATLDQILDGVQLGIVPVLWEDNLPQVALEFVAHGIPILTSDRGGAQEVGGNPDFVFPAGSRIALARKLRDISVGRLSLARFWDQPPRLPSMERHVADLIELYRSATEASQAKASRSLSGQPRPGRSLPVCCQVAEQRSASMPWR